MTDAGIAVKNEADDLSALVSTTYTPPTQEPLAFESMMHTIQEMRDQYPEPPIEILSPTEYFRRTGFRLPISEETLAALEPPPPMLTRLKQELIYGTSFMNIKDFYLPYRTPEGTGEMSLAAAQQMIAELKAQYATDTTWTISRKTHHALQRLGGITRRKHRAWLRTKRQRRARQRRHNRGLV